MKPSPMTIDGIRMNLISIFTFRKMSIKLATSDSPIINVPVPTALPYLGISSSLTFLLLYECMVLMLPHILIIPETDNSNPTNKRTISSITQPPKNKINPQTFYLKQRIRPMPILLWD